MKDEFYIIVIVCFGDNDYNNKVVLKYMEGKMSDKKNKISDYIEFYIGIISMAAGVFFLLSKSVVRSSFLELTIGGINVSTGIVVIPLMAGIIWLVNNPKSIIARIITIAGAIFIIASIIMNIRIHFTTTSLFDYLVMMILIAIGAGLIIKASKMARQDSH